ncbi:amidohydrolase family protein [Planctomycetota bacterium]
MRYTHSLILVLVVSAMANASDAIPATPQTNPIALVGGTIHPITSPPIENGTILFADGKISAIGEKIAIPEDAKQIDVTGKHVYPGLFNAGGQLGLVEIDSTRSTIDYSELGSINPNVRAETAVNPDSELIPVTRSNGVLLTLTVPTGGLISGSSAVLQLDGWTWEDLTLKSHAGIHVNWPQVGAGGENSKRKDPLEPLEELMLDVKAYAKARSADSTTHPVDLKLESMLRVIDRSVPMIVHAERAEQIQSAVAFAQRENVRLIIYGGYDAESCARLLRENDVPVIIKSVYRLPLRRSEPFDTPYTLPERLRKAGVQFCIAGVDRFGTSNLRNLPYNAATAVAYGLPRDEAMKAITEYPANILGVSDRVGSLEVGKDATLIVTNGFPLETWTNVESAFVTGGQLDLTDRHKTLWQKYRKKYQALRINR